MIICCQEFTDQIIEWIQKTVDKEPGLSRVALSRKVCERLGWRRANGKLKEMSCRTVLLKMDRRGIIRLPPAAQRPPVRSQKKRGSPAAAVAQPISCPLSEAAPIELVKINSADSKAARIWNQLMGQYHYLGSGPLCGAQIRYLIKSPRHGWLGGFSFSAAAWSVKARDEWIGWNKQARQENLEKVACNSRFLILPWVNIPHLASHVLSLCVKRLSGDWRERYGLELLLLETFVEQERFKGTCYRAANWQHVGGSQGRGRQDGTRLFSKGVKDVYLYPLIPEARERLCESFSKAMEEPPAACKALDWAEEEFGMARLGDKRVSERLLILARDLYDRPQANIPQACQSRAKTKAAYRFFSHPEVNMDKILESHFKTTLNRVSKEKVILAVQDTTSLNYSAHPSTTGMGPIGRSREGVTGLEVHDTMAFNLEGTPLGLLDVRCWARKQSEFGKRSRCHKSPIEQKESYKWLTSFKKVAEAQKNCPGTMLVSVGDREADIYEFFKLALADPSGPKVLVRAERNRLLADGQGPLWESMMQRPVAGIHVIHIPRRGKQPAREARLEVHFGWVKLKAPQRKSKLGGEFKIWAVLAQELDAPAGIEPLEWMLLTTIEVNVFEQAVERLSWYARRWGIEVYHKTLKSGCKVEQRQFGSADNIKACLAIDMVVAWRIFHLTKLGRETPNVPCTVFFEEAEWKALHTYVYKNPSLPEKPPTLREATRMVAGIGGFLGRKSDGEPGTQSIWLGMQVLDAITAMWSICQNPASHILLYPPCPAKTYG